jgi:hypothetical protein
VKTDVARMEVQRFIEEVDVQLNRIVSARDHRIYAGTTGEILMPLRASLEEVLSDKSRTLNARQGCLLSLALARVYDELVHYEEANRFYNRACPSIIRSFTFDDIGSFEKFLLGSPMACQVTTLLFYFDFAIRTNRDLVLVEHMLRMLPWTPSPSIEGSVMRRISLYTTRVLNAQHNFKESKKHDAIHYFRWGRPFHEFGALNCEQGIFLAALGWHGGARKAFVESLAIGSISKGLWH